jgi:transposase-like protein
MLRFATAKHVRSSTLINRKFSEDFKRKKVSELERNLITVSELCREYQLSGTSVFQSFRR